MNHHKWQGSLLVCLFLPMAGQAVAHGVECGHPFQYAGTVNLAAGNSGSVGEFTVPAGQRLQIEYVSAGIRLSTADGIAAFSVGATAHGVFAWHPLPILRGYAAVDRLTSGVVLLYADAGSLVKLEINRGSGGSAAQAGIGQFAVSGCLYPQEKRPSGRG